VYLFGEKVNFGWSMTTARHYIRLALPSFALLFLVFLHACSKSPGEKAQEFIDAGMYEQAKIVLSGAIEESPKNARLHFMLGRCLLATRDISQAQDSFERATRLDANYGDLISKEYYSEAVAATKANDRDFLFSQAARFDPSIKAEIARIYMAEAISKIDAPIEVVEPLVTSTVEYDQTLAKQLASVILDKAKDQLTSTLPFSHLEALSVLAFRLDPTTNAAWASIFFNTLSSDQAIKDPSTALSIGTAASERDASLRAKIAHFYIETAQVALSGSPVDSEIVIAFFSAATNLVPALKPEVAELVWAHLETSLSNLKSLGSKGFSDLFTICEELELSQIIRNSGRYRLAQALKAWADGRRASALELLTALASNEGDSFEAKIAKKILAPPLIGKRSVQDKSFLFETWSHGPGGGKGVDIQLISYDIQSDQISLSFSVKSGDHKDLLLYAPQNVHEKFGSNCEALYILDDNGKKFYTTSGWLGGV